MGMTANPTVRWFCPSCQTWKTERINLKCESCRAKTDYGIRDHGDECQCHICQDRTKDA